jgi:hypothetical protein
VQAALGTEAATLSYFDNTTKSSIAFFPSPGNDAGYTEAGTWISYNEAKSVKAITEYCMSMGLRGAFAFDSSQDTKDYALMNLIADTIGGHGVAPPPGPPSPGPPSPGPPSPPGPPPPTPPGTGNCAGKAAGMYCVPGDNSSFVYCPQNAVEQCAAKTCCKATAPGAIVCDWCKSPGV